MGARRREEGPARGARPVDAESNRVIYGLVCEERDERNKQAGGRVSRPFALAFALQGRCEIKTPFVPMYLAYVHTWMLSTVHPRLATCLEPLLGTLCLKRSELTTSSISAPGPLITRYVICGAKTQQLQCVLYLLDSCCTCTRQLNVVARLQDHQFHSLYFVQSKRWT